MATYQANTAITKAIPSSVGSNVQSWHIQTTMTHKAANGYSWSAQPSVVHVTVAANNQTASQYTKTQLMAFVNTHSTQTERQAWFDKLYESAHTVPTIVTANNDFDVSELDD